jgi:RND family efflux transporter MFP subunit
MIRRIIYLFLVTIVFGGLAGAVAWYAFDFKPNMLREVILGSPQPPQTVSAAEATTETWQPLVAAIGTLMAPDGINVTPEVGGTVKDIGFESGAAVKKGDILLHLETATEDAQLANLRIQLGNAERELARRQKLSINGFAAKAEIDKLETARDVLKASIAELETVIAKKTITAPWDGRLGLRQVSPGSYVSPGMPLVWLQRTDPVYVDFAVTEEDYGRMAPGSRLTAQFNAFPGQSFAGTVITSDARLNDQSRMITMRGELANAEGRLLPGMYADVKVDVGAPETVVTVPQTAVIYSLYGDNVLAVVPATKLDAKAKEGELAIERRFVKAGPARDGRVQITSGIAAGEQVVTAGHNKIDQGSKVVIDNKIALKAPENTTNQ